MSQITPREAHAKMSQGWYLVDVRPTAAYDQFHAPESFNIPFDRDFLQNVKDTFSTHDLIILTCADGTDSTHALIKLAANEFEYLHEVRGGMNAWARDPSLPLVRR